MSTSLYWGRYPAQLSTQRYPMQPFHFDPALAGQDVSSGSSSSSVVCYLIFFYYKESCEKFHFLLFRDFFYSQKGTSAFLCSSSTVLQEKRQINFLHDCKFFSFFSLNIKVGQSWSWSWNRSRLLFSGSSQIRAAPGGSGFTKEYRYRYLPVSNTVLLFVT